MNKTRVISLTEEAKKLIEEQDFQTADEKLNLASFFAAKNYVAKEEIMELRKLLYQNALDQLFPEVRSSFECKDFGYLHTLVSTLDMLILYASRAKQAIPVEVTELREYIADVYCCKTPRPLVHNKLSFT